MSGILIGDGINSTSVYDFISPTEQLMLFMFVTKVFAINVSLPCSEIGQEYSFIFSSQSDEIFEIQSNSSMIFTCKNEDTDVSDIAGRYTDATGVINERVEVALRGNLIGISDLIIEIQDRDIAVRQTDVFYSNTSINGTYFIGHRQAIGAKDSSTKMAGQIPVLAVDNNRWRTGLPVTVLRNLRPVDKIFMYLVTVFLFIITMGFGCKLDLGIVKECLKKPVAPGIGFGCQYLVMPLLGFAIAKLLPLGTDKSVALGIFVCGVCPGGGVSNIYAYLLDGDVSLSITMTFLSTVASIGMMPLWIYTLGKLIMDENYSVSIPYVNMAQIIALITVPLFIGIVIKYKFLKVAITILKILKPVTVISILVFMVVGLYSNWFIFKLFRPLHIIAGCLLPYLGYVIGGVIAAVLKQPFTRVKTIALETGMQNVGVAYLLMISSFPPPHGDLASVAPMASALMTPIPPFIVTIFYLVYKKCCKDYELVDVDEPEVKVDAGKDKRVNDSEQMVEKLSAV